MTRIDEDGEFLDTYVAILRQRDKSTPVSVADVEKIKALPRHQLEEARKEASQKLRSRYPNLKFKW